MSNETTFPRHTTLDDTYGLFTGVVLSAVGIAVLAKGGVITGESSGMALLISYVTPWTPAQLLPVVNLPFILFGLFTMGRAFAAKTLAVSLSLSVAVHIATEMLLPHVDPAFAWIAGGTLLGIGILCFARHNASIGGTGVVTLWMQKRYGINAGKAQMVFDACLFVVAAFIQPWEQLAWSLCAVCEIHVDPVVLCVYIVSECLVYRLLILVRLIGKLVYTVPINSRRAHNEPC